jgi:hypothetical protein
LHFVQPWAHLSTCVDIQSPKYLEMAQGHISLSGFGEDEGALTVGQLHAPCSTVRLPDRWLLRK